MVNYSSMLSQGVSLVKLYDAVFIIYAQRKLIIIVKIVKINKTDLIDIVVCTKITMCY